MENEIYGNNVATYDTESLRTTAAFATDQCFILESLEWNLCYISYTWRLISQG